MNRPKSYFLYHLHSDYSLLDSCTDFKEYVDLVKRDGGTAIASTEHGLPRGWIHKKLYCDENGIKFVHGVEIYLTERLEPKVRDNYHTVLLAKNPDGVTELNRLVSLSSNAEHTYYTNRISFDEFLSISDNIIKISACLASPLNKFPEDNPMYEKVLKHYDYLEVQPHNHPDQVSYNKKLANLSRKYGIPLVAGTDTHSSTPYKAECRNILLAAKRKSYGDEDAFDLTYKTVDELLDMFKVQNALTEEEYYAAVENTNKIADDCKPFELDKSIKYPILHGSQEEDERIFVQIVYRLLDEKLEKGIIPREQEQAFRAAIEEELRVFKKLKMCGFMLSMSDLVRWCKQEGMAIGTARGSVGGSRVAYVTDIIDLNPETWHTVFSRFANEDRKEIGDIDIDVVYDDRPRIFEYITNRFGADRTARVAAYGTLADKSVIDEVCRALAIKVDKNKYSLEAAKKIKQRFSEDPDGARKDYPDVFYYYDGLAETRISQSVHPAGMVISPISLIDTYGTFVKDGEMCLLMDMDEAHEVGAAKYDFLALKTVRVIRDVCNYIGASYPKTHEVDWNDTNVWRDMIKDQTAIFQFESFFAAESFKKFRPQNIFEMSLVAACIRPSGTSYRDDLLERKQHHNPSIMIDELLADNLGYLIYQEDTIKFLQQICGLSGSEADNIRRAIGRKQKDRLEEALPAILEGYCSKSDKSRDVAENEAMEFLQVIEDSASYQFGYNHSIAYCLLGYLCGYYRYYYPMEFITAFLNNAQNDKDIENGTKLMKLYGIKISNPKWGVSRGDFFFDKENKTIYKGVGSMKFMSNEIGDELMRLSSENTYSHFVDLLFDLKNRSIANSKQISNLIKIDYFSSFGNQKELLTIFDIFHFFKNGEAKQISKENASIYPIEDVIRKYASGKTKSGDESKSYILFDVRSILRECEEKIKGIGMEDIDVISKVQNFFEIMGYYGYISGNQNDRKKLFVKNVFPAKRRRDGKQYGYYVLTQSIGSGVEGRFKVYNRLYNENPISQNDVILLTSFERNGSYFNLTGYKPLN